MYPSYPNHNQSAYPNQSMGFNHNIGFSNDNQYPNQGGYPPYPNSNNNPYPSQPPSQFSMSNQSWFDQPQSQFNPNPAPQYQSQFNAPPPPTQSYQPQSFQQFPSQFSPPMAQPSYGQNFNSNMNYPQSSNNFFPTLPTQQAQFALQANPTSNFQTNANPVLKPHSPFNPNDDCAKLYKAMKGFGTDETMLIDILCKRTSQQRQELLLSYKTGYGKDLIKNLESETSGNFQRLFKSLMRTPAQLEAKDLMNAIDGLGTNEAALIDIICTKTNSEMNELKNAFRQLFNKDLEREVGSDVSGYFKRFLVSLIAANRSSEPPNHSKAVQQAKELYEAGAKQFGTNEVVFNRIFAGESFPHLRLVFDEYKKITGHDIETAIRREMSTSVQRAFLAVAQTAKHPPTYWANRLHETMVGAGTHERSLIRIMVLRSERDMLDVKREFQSRHKSTLESFLKGDLSGHLKRALLCLAGDPNWR